MSFFQKKKPKQFGLTSRFDGLKKENENSMESKWDELRSHSKLKKGRMLTLPKLILMLIMVLILLYVLRTYEF